MTHPAPAPRPITVVLVEDHLATRELICEHLNTDPAVQLLAKAHDGLSGIAAVREHAPDVVLMDLSLPVLDGWKAAEVVRHTCPRTHLIAITNYSFPDMQERAREARQTVPWSAFLLKQDIATRLLPTIHTLVSRGAPR